MDILKHIQSNQNQQFFLIAGPCVVESKELCMEVGQRVMEITTRLNIPFIFKSSFRKANRTRNDSFTGHGDAYGLEILAEVSQRLGVPVTTDIHESPQAELAAAYVDILQIPAFLCRQTELLQAAGQTGKVVSIKKGQFLSPLSMKFAVDKVHQTGNKNVWLIERGTTFGYQDLVVDYRSIPEMKSIGVPVIMDCTHALQQPNQTAGVTGGNPQMISTISAAAIATGADGLFIETHPRPAEALSDGANMLQLDLLEPLLQKLVRIREAIRES